MIFFQIKLTKGKRVAINRGLSTMNAIFRLLSNCIFHNLLNPSNRKICCFVVMEITNYRSVTEQTWNDGLVCRCQRGNQNPEIEGQTTQWPKEKGQKDKQWFTKHTHKTKDRVTRTSLNKLWCYHFDNVLDVLATLYKRHGIVFKLIGNIYKYWLCNTSIYIYILFQVTAF
jgi:hypothetical protein